MRNIIGILDGTQKLETIQKGDICVISYKHNNKTLIEYCTIHDIPNQDEIIIKLRLWKTIDLKLIRIKLEYVKSIYRINIMDSYDDIINNDTYQSWELELVINDEKLIIEPNKVYLIKLVNNLNAHIFRLIYLDLDNFSITAYDTRTNKTVTISIYDIENVYL